MRIYILFLILLLNVKLFSQVGINTENPQQLFHTDGKSSEGTINPTTGVPSNVQQVDDVVITNLGRIGIGTITPSEKLEVNGKTKINDLPINSTNGFIGTRTLIADNNGVIGVINGLPSGAYNGYHLTGMQGFDNSKAVNRIYTYNQLVSTNCHNADETPNVNAVMCYVPSNTDFQYIYSTNFQKASNQNEKYMFVSFDYLFNFNTIGGAVPPTSFWIQYDIQILVNGSLVRTNSPTFTISAGGGVRYAANKVVTVDLTNINLNSNNSLQIILKPTRSIIKNNRGTASGNFLVGNNNALTLSLTDISFFIYEK